VTQQPAGTLPPSGRQFEIALGDQRATVVEVSGGIREYVVGDRPVLDPYPVDAICDGAHGDPLIPWPNRLADGRYRWDGEEYQVPLTEPEKSNAIHGLLMWRPWEPVEQEPHRVVLGIRLHPQTGYPFRLDVRLEYRLTDDGLVVETTATNAGDRDLPYGYGHHPYLSAGAGAVLDDCTLQLDGATRVLTDEARQLPAGLEPVEGTPFDFRSGGKLGSLQIDHAFTDLVRDADGRAGARLTGPDGATAEFWTDRSSALVQIYTGDTLAPPRRRRGLGTEPMTVPPNAFATGEHVIRLAPGESVTTRWGARLVR